MTERPILFSDAMVRAILAGTKTQTRRVIAGARGAFWDHRSYTGTVERDGVLRFRVGPDGEIAHGSPEVRCPYGAVGDRLWVREAHAQFQIGRDPLGVAYRSTCDGNEFDYVDGFNSIRRVTVTKWTPSIFLPRWASRLTLEVTSIRVERVQSISEEDARAEGVEPLLVPPDGGSAPYREGFERLWDSINGERAGCSWAANPWCWVVSFKRAEAA